MPVYVKIKKNLGGFSLDVEFQAGDEVMGLLGASGCGKSMTLNCVAGLLRPDEGKIVVNGRTFFDSEKNIDLPPQARGVGLLFQNCALFPNMTVAQNIICAMPKGRRAGLWGRAGKMENAEKLRSLTEKFYLSGLENRYPAQLSGGQKQRAALARIMAGQPSVLMLDEPLSALDSYLRWQLEGELLQVFDDFGGAVLYVSHNRDEVYRLCGNVCVIDSGRSEHVRAAKELFERPDTFASAVLSGCKNYSRADKIDSRTVRALDWGVDLRCGAELSGDVGYVGVRAHNVALTRTERAGENIFPCRVARVVEDVSSIIVNLEPLSGEPLCGGPGSRGFSRLRAEFPKRQERFGRGDVVFAEIAPSGVMPLKK